ncbi:hypothetical protein L210DRAFT_3654122 [Boletus edulis BED1]|uniref:Uncharacterized protein n=1 Tax=Boletus edulis BED1 TaxID=1328754 RepID=A0AAD4BEE2_BOLED|nr:hypothetical protein L210DRAFT_3654118 [Boletus edulis BED1]KAF8422337.1 hypothetical protein L210DRAFT_3654122 [Boletus edulis BED1]
MNLVHPFERHPEEREPVASSLLGFNNMFIGLDARRGQENEHRVRAAAQVHTLVLLTGLNVPKHRWVIVEPLRNRLHQPSQLDISRDFDSLISFTDELPVVQDLYIYRVFHQTMVLTKSLHVKVLMQTTPEQVGVDTGERFTLIHLSFGSLPSLSIPTKSSTSVLCRLEPGTPSASWMKEIYQAGICHTAAARVEARVPARSAVRAMLDFPEDFLDHTLCRYPAVDWWCVDIQ